MKVKSKLANVDFEIGSMERKDNLLIITNDPAQPMRSKVYVSPEDAVLFIKKLLVSPSALAFIFGLPYFYFRARKASGKKKTKTHTR